MFRLIGNADGELPPGAARKGPVILAHGLFGNGGDWFNSNDATRDPTPIRLLNDGYDVWLYNDRGNPYSRGDHATLDAEVDAAFWDFTAEDIAVEDIPLVIEEVTKISGTCIKASIVGFSAGADAFMRALANADVKSSNYIKSYVGMAPALFANVA